MSELRKELHRCLDTISDKGLVALKPLLTLLSHDDDELVIETDLTDEEREIVARGWEEYSQGGYIPLEDIIASMSEN